MRLKLTKLNTMITSMTHLLETVTDIGGYTNGAPALLRQETSTAFGSVA